MTVPASRPRAGRRRRAASFLTAAALQLATLPGTTDAFVAPSARAGGARCAGIGSSSRGTLATSSGGSGPLHAALVSSGSTAALRMSAGSSLDVAGSAHRRAAVTAQLANNINLNGNFNPPLVGSTVVPSTAFLSSRRVVGEAGLSIPSAASKYGGRASGSCDACGAGGDDGRTGTALVNSSRGSLGFVVVDDIPSAAASAASSARRGRTSLAVSRSLPDQADQMDASFFGDGSAADDDRRRLGDLVDDEIGIVEADASTSSPVRRRVAESLRRAAKESVPSTVPAWFPWIPTRSQIETLKVPELRDACNERGLAKVRRSGVNS